MKTYKSLKSTIYKDIDSIKNSRFRDEDWSGIRSVFNRISDIIDGFNKIYDAKFSFGWYVENGGYRVSKDGLSRWKEYKMRIEDCIRGKEYFGIATCGDCGTIEDPFSVYDICVIFE